MTQGSRLLNDNGSVIGLNVYDLVLAIAVLVGTGEGLRPVGLDVLAMPLAGLTLAALVPLRLRTRRKIIRDAAGRVALSILRGGMIHDPLRHS